MPQNARVTAFTVCELLRENQQGGLNYPPPLPPRLGLKFSDKREELKQLESIFPQQQLNNLIIDKLKKKQEIKK